MLDLFIGEVFLYLLLRITPLHIQQVLSIITRLRKQPCRATLIWGRTNTSRKQLCLRVKYMLWHTLGLFIIVVDSMIFVLYEIKILL